MYHSKLGKKMDFLTQESTIVPPGNAKATLYNSVKTDITYSGI
jgi:hypothetical protein